MKDKIRRKNSIILFVIVFLLMSGLMAAQAATGDDVLNDEGLKQGGFMYGIAFIGAKFVSWGGALVNWSLNLNNGLMDGTALKSGWPISRDIANLGFVLAIILIAFATILRVESYAMKQTLWKLITAALLVNFSLIIAGVFIDFSGVLTNFFISSTSDPSKFATALAGALKIQAQLGSPPDTSALEQIAGFITGGWGKALLEFLANMFFIIFFTGIAAISMMGLAAMLYIRYLALTILLILMPIAWLLWIWPDTQGNWKKWWGEFFRWVWFAPAMSFFLYLAIAIVNKAADKSMGLSASFGAETFIFANAGETIGQLLSVVGILIGGMIAANSASIAGAGLTMGAAKGFSRFVGGTVIGGTGRMAGRAIGDRIKTMGYKPPDEKGMGGGGWIQRTAARYAGTPFVGGVARATSQWASAGGKELVTNYEKDFSKLAEDKNAFLNTAKSPALASDTIRNPAKAAAYINIAAEKGMINDLRKADPQLFESLIKSSEKMGTAAKIYSRNPTLAGLGKKGEERKIAIRKWVKKMTPADAVNLAIEDLYDEKTVIAEGKEYHPTTLLGLTKPILKKMSMEAKGGQIEAINQGIEKIKQMLAANELQLDAQEKINWEYLQNWDNDSPVAQLTEFGIPKKEKEIG